MVILVKSFGLIWVLESPPTHTFFLPNLAHHLLRQNTVRTVGCSGASKSLVLPSLSSMQLMLRARARLNRCCAYASMRLTLRARAQLSCGCTDIVGQSSPARERRGQGQVAASAFTQRLLALLRAHKRKHARRIHIYIYIYIYIYTHMYVRVLE